MSELKFQFTNGLSSSFKPSQRILRIRRRKSIAAIATAAGFFLSASIFVLLRMDADKKLGIMELIIEWPYWLFP